MYAMTDLCRPSLENIKIGSWYRDNRHAGRAAEVRCFLPGQSGA